MSFYPFQQAARLAGRAQTEYREVAVLRQVERGDQSFLARPVGLERPQKQGVLCEEVPPQLFAVAIPKRGALYTSAYGAPEETPEDDGKWVVEPDDGGCARPCEVADDGVIAVCDPSVCGDGLGHVLPENAIGRRVPVGPVPVRVELDVGNAHARREVPGEGRLSRARRSDDDHAAKGVSVRGIEHGVGSGGKRLKISSTAECRCFSFRSRKWRWQK